MSVRCRFGVSLMSVWCQFGVSLMSVWCHFDLMLEKLRFGFTFLDHVCFDFVILSFFAKKINIKYLPEILAKCSVQATKTNPSAHIDSANAKTILYALITRR